MIPFEEIHCPYCKGDQLQKNGKNINGCQRCRCNLCKKYFQREYRYNTYKQGVKEKIIEMTLNGSVVRDAGRVLQISKNTVVAVLKKNAKNQSVLSE